MKFWTIKGSRGAKSQRSVEDCRGASLLWSVKREVVWRRRSLFLNGGSQA